MNEFTFHLEEIDPLEIYGVNDQRLSLIKTRYPHVRFVARGNELMIKGPKKELEDAQSFLLTLLEEIQKKGGIREEKFQEYFHIAGAGEGSAEFPSDEFLIHGARGSVIQAKTAGQREILESSKKNDIVFAIGPAGTGKTYISVAIAVKALKEKEIKKIFLVRPAVEAGESLGFLPGDLKEKVDPYLRPLYDALEDMIHFDKLRSYLEKNVIEIAPLAYMRGRTLSNCYVILDEAQNATDNQFKMFLTRLGKGGKIIITGDDSQVDLPRNMRSGLRHAMHLLQGIEGIGFVRMKPSDVVRHRLVKKIIEAYEKGSAEEEQNR